MSLSKMGLFATLSINDIQHNVFSVIILSVIMMNVVMLSVVAPLLNSQISVFPAAGIQPHLFV